MKYLFENTKDNKKLIIDDSDLYLDSCASLLKHLNKQGICKQTEGTLCEVLLDYLNTKYKGRIIGFEGKKAKIREVVFHILDDTNPYNVIFLLDVDSTPGIYKKIVNFNETIDFI